MILPPGVTIRSPGEGELGQLFGQVDWAKTPVGPMESWPVTLKGYARMILMLPTPAIIFWGPELVQLYNDGYATIMGPRHPRHLGSTYQACWPDTYPTIYPWMQRVLQGDVVEVDRTLIPLTRHGFNEEAHFTFTFSPLRDDAGQIAGLLQIVTEMTSTVLAERRERTLRTLSPSRELSAPRDRPEHFCSVLRQNPYDLPWAALYLMDEDSGGLRLEASLGADADLGEARRIAQTVLETGAQVERDDWDRFTQGPASGPWPEPVKKIVALPLRRTEAEAPRGVVVLGASPRLHFDDRYASFFQSVARELASYFAIHQELALAEQLKLALESAKLGTWIIDLPSNRIRLSHRTASFLGPETGRDEDFHRINAAMVHPEDLARVESALRAAVEHRELYSAEYRIRRPDGEIRWLQSWGRASYGRDGEPRSVSGVTLDVTETRHLVEKLSAAVRARDEFLSIASHELKTPLTSLILHVQGQRRALAKKGESSPVLARLIQQIEKQSARLTRLVNDMLDVSRIDAGRLDVRLARMDLCALMAETVDRLKPQFDAASVPLRWECGEELLVDADADRVEQVVVNLLTNALRYGGRTPVDVALVAVDGRARLSIRDQGPGLSQQDAARVFERFERAVPMNDGGGLGLGLYIARQIVLQHRGRIWVESEVGRGATFLVELPRSAADLDEASSQGPGSSLATG